MLRSEINLDPGNIHIQMITLVQGQLTIHSLPQAGMSIVVFCIMGNSIGLCFCRVTIPAGKRRRTPGKRDTGPMMRNHGLAMEDFVYNC